ncbi:MAG: hypothetical protein CMC93_02995 [Flavobacteriaceae bacterium]|nr:hypothetical protein [Flavobacteriaceae bacterium]
MNKILTSLLFTSLFSFLLLLLPNNSNFPSYIAVPILASALTKYTIGDWDKNFQWSSLDFLFWISILTTSLLTIKLYKLLHS